MHRLGLLWMIAACHDTGTPLIDALDVQPDVRVEEPGLFVTWRAEPRLPGPVTDLITLSAVTFGVDRFEVQSDADSKTSRSRYSLSWSSSTSPAQEAFRDAPSGVYSRVSITLGGFFTNAYELEGTWLDRGKLKPFRIADRGRLKTSFELSKTLEAGGSTTIPIQIQLAEALRGIDFARLHERDGRLELTTGDPQLTEFRDLLDDAFRIAD
jgi:hypothetical protein